MRQGSETFDVVVVGGGAAGFFAAVTCAAANPTARIALLERSSHVLAKVRVSGGGRCNVTHACFDPARLATFYPRGARELRGPFSRFQPSDTVAWFAERGVALKTEDDGRMFPVTDSSQTIVDCLTDAAARAGIVVRRQVLISSVTKRAEGGFSLALQSGLSIDARRLLLATGSNPQGWKWAQALGHAIVPPVPSLFTFTVADQRLDGLSGVSVPEAVVHLSDTRLEQRGPLLITHWGLSGPAALKLSAWGARIFYQRDYQANLVVNWVNGKKADIVESELRRFRAAKAHRTAAAGGPYAFPKRLWMKLTNAAGISPEVHWTAVSNAQLTRLSSELTAGKFRMTGKSPFKEEFVTCGGVRLDEVDFRTMESKKCPGLYFAGEVLDIDAITGGFNFQAAWTTGYLAGTSAACL